MGLEATPIPRHVKVQHIEAIANVFADSVSRLSAVGLYDEQEFSSSFEPLPSVEQMTHMLIEVNGIFIAPDIEKLAENNDVLHTYQLYRSTKLNYP